MDTASMSVDDVAGWASAQGFDESVVRALRDEEIDGPMLAIYATKEDHELLKRDLALSSGKAGKLWRALREVARPSGKPPGKPEEGTPPSKPDRPHYSGPVPARDKASRPHFGRSTRSTAPTPMPAEHAAVPMSPKVAGKHAMLSYQWYIETLSFRSSASARLPPNTSAADRDEQDKVIHVRDLLNARGVPTWMDIDGGMEVDIYDSMASGVQNAFCVVAFTTQRYQESSNCQLELKFAKQCGVPIVTVKLEDGWKPTGWLGVITAGTLWVPLFKQEQRDSAVHSIESQIRLHADACDAPETPKRPTEVDFAPDSAADSPPAGATLADTSAAELRSELDSLRAQVAIDAAADERQIETGGLAFIPAQVPPLTGTIRWTADMNQLKKRLLVNDSGAIGTVAVSSAQAIDRSTAVGRQAKVGAFGMGGIGKTVMAACIARDEEIRKHFDCIVWITLSQTPEVQKCLTLMHLQLAGKELPADKSVEEAQEILRQLMHGKKALLVIDDAWDEEMEQIFSSCCDDSSSKILVTTRIRGLLKQAEQIEVGLPSEADAVDMLLNSAGICMEDEAPAPPEAVEIVNICGRLPLAVDIAGKLLIDLVDSGQAWTGVPEILRQEMSRAARSDGDESAIEYRVISASLNSIPARDQQDIRRIFTVFALVAEDTHIPPQMFRILLAAVAGSRQLVSELQLRRWLQTLINRSLVLGTWERPQLHDIVLEYSITQHSPEHIAKLQKQVVDALFAARPESLDPNMCGLPCWQCQPGDPAAFYVEHDGRHHVDAALAKLDLSELPEYLAQWLSHYPGAPFDQQHPGCTMAKHVALSVGVERLQAVVQLAKGRSDWWLVKQVYFALFIVKVLEDGFSEDIMVFSQEILAPMFDAFRRLLQKPMSVTELQWDHSNLVGRIDLLQLVNFFGPGLEIAEDETRVRDDLRRLSETSSVARRRPKFVDTTTYAVDVAPLYLKGDVQTADARALELWQRAFRRTVAEAGTASATRYVLLLTNVSPDMGDFNVGDCFGTMMRLPGWDWEVYGSDCASLAEIFKSVHELVDGVPGEKLYDMVNSDEYVTAVMTEGFYVIDSWHSAAAITAHRGHITLANCIADTGKKWISRVTEALHKLEQSGNGDSAGASVLRVAVPINAMQSTTALRLLGRAADGIGMLKGLDLDWVNVDATLDNISFPAELCRPRGVAEDPANPTLLSVDSMSAASKVNCVLCGEEISQSDLLAALPSIQEVRTLTTSGRPVTTLNRAGFFSLGLAVALVYETMGEVQMALEHVEDVLRDEHLSDPQADLRPTTHCEAHALRGRLLVALGENSAAEAAFEASVQLAQRCGLRLLEMFALRDLAQCVHGGRPDARCLSRLHSVLLKMRATPSELTALLKLRGGSFDAKELLSSASALDWRCREAQTSNVSGQATPARVPAPTDGSAGGLATELQGMRTMALHGRAVSEGLDSERLEDAMDADNPKASLIKLLLEHSSGAVDVEKLRQELGGMRTMALHRRAVSEGADAEKLEDAMDADNPKAALIELLVEKTCADLPDMARARAVEELRTELAGMRTMALHRRAVSEGVDADSVEDAMDSNNAKATLIELIVGAF